MRRWLLERVGLVRRIGPRCAVAVASTLLVAAALVMSIAVHRVRLESTRHPAPGDAKVRVATDLAGARVAVDGIPRGLTPASVALAPGLHHLLVSHPLAVSQQLDIEIDHGATAHLDVALRHLPPSVLPLHAPLPGARIAGFAFLRDGRLVMTIAIPPGDALELWLVDGTGATRRFGPTSAHGAAALSPDGRLATFTSSPGPDGASRYDGVQLVSADGKGDGPVLRVSGQGPGEDLESLAWSPDGRSLLVATARRTAAGTEGGRLVLRDVTSDDAASTRELLMMPATMVPGSASWSPTGRWIAFVARARDADALVAIDTRSGEIRPLGDLGQAGMLTPPFPPLDWSPDGTRLLFAAPDSGPASASGWPFGARRPSVLWVFDTTTGTIHRLGAAPGRAPTWHGSGPPLAFARSGTDGAVILEALGPDGRAHDVARLPIATEGPISALWDDAHGQAVLATTAASVTSPDALEFWWVRFLPGDAEHA